jgi:hypothetical protein
VQHKVDRISSSRTYVKVEQHRTFLPPCLTRRMTLPLNKQETDTSTTFFYVR